MGIHERNAEERADDLRQAMKTIVSASVAAARDGHGRVYVSFTRDEILAVAGALVAGADGEAS